MKRRDALIWSLLGSFLVGACLMIALFIYWEGADSWYSPLLGVPMGAALIAMHWKEVLDR